VTPRETMLRELSRRAQAVASCALLHADGYTADAMDLGDALTEAEECCALLDSIIDLDETADPLEDA